MYKLISRLWFQASTTSLANQLEWLRIIENETILLMRLFLVTFTK